MFVIIQIAGGRCREIRVFIFNLGMSRFSSSLSSEASGWREIRTELIKEPGLQQLARPKSGPRAVRAWLRLAGAEGLLAEGPRGGTVGMQVASIPSLSCLCLSLSL